MLSTNQVPPKIEKIADSRMSGNESLSPITLILLSTVDRLGYQLTRGY